ncbi:MAG: PocR ligand-binding domain-containing protein, partial [Christensenellales bacterium]
MLELDKKRMIPILKNFHTLTGFNFAIYNQDMEEIASYPGNSPFCSYIYQSPASSICVESNISAKNKCIKSNNCIPYKCPFHIWDTISPLNLSDRIIGYIMVGQARDSVTPETLPEDISGKIAEYNLDPTLFSELFSKLPIADSTKINACISIVSTYIIYLYSENIIRDKANIFVQNIEDYITAHLDCDLSVENLCDVFSFSRAHLHRLFKANFGISISRYIQNKRIACAKKLLSEEKLSIGEIA